MTDKFYHGDPQRDHNFWVYPKDKPLENTCWDTYNASQFCDNYTFLGKNGGSELETYRCNGHDQ